MADESPPRMAQQGEYDLKTSNATIVPISINAPPLVLVLNAGGQKLEEQRQIQKGQRELEAQRIAVSPQRSVQAPANPHGNLMAEIMATGKKKTSAQNTKLIDNLSPNFSPERAQHPPVNQQQLLMPGLPQASPKRSPDQSYMSQHGVTEQPQGSVALLPNLLTASQTQHQN